MDYISVLDHPILSRLTRHKGFPQGLYVIGDLESLLPKTKFVTIVGSRTHSATSARVVEKIVRELSRYNITIISGMALGIDSCAHKAALDNNMTTIAFPGSGLDDSVRYPRSNYSLSKKIVQNRGVLISEFEPLTKAARWTFPKRNRLMAHLADLVLIIEARDSSGTLITAHAALDANIDVAVIPHSIENTHALGSNKLIQQGAHPILSYADILDLLNIKKEEKEHNITTLSSHQRIIMKFLTKPTPKQDLFELSSSEMTFQIFSRCLSEMELQGLISERYGLVTRL